MQQPNPEYIRPHHHPFNVGSTNGKFPLSLGLDCAMGGIILEHADRVVKVNEGTTGGTNSQFVRVKCSPGAQMLNTAKSIYSDLDIMSQECGWHRMKRCGCRSTRERQRASKHALFCSQCVSWFYSHLFPPRILQGMKDSLGVVGGTTSDVLQRTPQVVQG